MAFNVKRVWRGNLAEVVNGDGNDKSQVSSFEILEKVSNTRRI